MAITVGGVSGGAFNPAVGLLALVSAPASGIPSGVWIYWVAPPLAGLLAGLVFRITNAPEFVRPEDCPRETNGKYKRQKRHTNLYGKPDPDVAASFNAFFPPVGDGVEVAKYVEPSNEGELDEPPEPQSPIRSESAGVTPNQGALARVRAAAENKQKVTQVRANLKSNSRDALEGIPVTVTVLSTEVASWMRAAVDEDPNDSSIILEI